ncbi:MAG: polysaccharide deacetylase family protein [Lachnospiraceae bacterium]|nr:polysaccharide deacetylase family protein [Lachnospiraceae bacterium]
MKKKSFLSVICAVTVTTLTVLSGCGSTGATSGTVDLNSFNRISYDATSEYTAALEKYNNGCDGARIIRDDASLSGKKIALILQGAEDSVLVEQAIELLEDHRMKASFAVTALEAAEDDNTLKLISSKGHEVVDNGLNGRDAIESMSDEEIIYDLASSRKVFSTLMDFTPDKLMLNSTYYTDSICMAAGACGYSRLIAPKAGNYLNKRSFADRTKAKEYVGRLASGSILVFKLNGTIDALEMEPKVDYQKPAIDKQPGTEVSNEKLEDDRTIQVLSWLLDALDNEGCQIVKLGTMKAMSDQEYVAQLLKEDDLTEARVYDEIETMEDMVGLSFYGLPSDEAAAEELAGILQEYHAGATFFVSSSELDSAGGTAQELAKAGFCFGTKGQTGEDLAAREAYEDYTLLREAVRRLQKDLSLKPKFYMPVSRVDTNLSRAVAAAGLAVVSPVRNIRAQKGVINCFDLSNGPQIEKVTDFLKQARKAGLEVVDIASLVETADSVPDLDEETLKALREANEGRLAAPRDFVYTSENAMALTFYGVSNGVVVDDVLRKLSARNYKATFFATQAELSACSVQIRKILEQGHELGIAYIDKGEETDSRFDDVATYVIGAQKYAEWKYDTQISLVFQPYGDVADETMEAVSAAGCTFVGHEYGLVQSKYVDAQDVSSFYGELSEKIEPHRGSIAYFNMNYFTVDKELAEGTEETLLGSLLNRFIATKIDSLIYIDVFGQAQSSTAYTVKTFGALAHSGYVYAPGSGSSGQVYDKKNVLGSMASAQEQNHYMASRYIGNPDVSIIPGISKDDIGIFDVNGKINAGRVLFLTFDDWGNETDVNELLYVLDKYGVKGNFFVRTNNVHNNPNLLRAIAVDGHMVASHSDSHYVAWHASQDEAGNYIYETITDQEAAELRADVVKSYGVLSRYCGDVVIDGKPALSTIYRPPTLAVSRAGMYQIFDVGYTYIVSGDFSTADYNAPSVDALVSELRNGKSTWYGRAAAGDGSVLVMHMSPNAMYTAEALDIMIPEWLAAGYTIARLDDYLK